MDLVLIVEDDNINYILIKEYLLRYGIISLLAKNGHEAVDYVRSKPDIKLVLMDLCMPEMDGTMATQLIKKMRPELPVVAQTAYLFNNIQNDFEQFGFSAFLSKPYSQEQLWEIINPLL
jgi:CheY-like chemotaxis protein